MTDSFEEALQQAMVDAYDTPRDAPDLANRVVALDGKRRPRQRVGAAVTASVLVALVICVPLLVRGDAHRSSPGAPASASTGVSAPSTSPAKSSASFAELEGWWRFTHLQAPGGSVPILRGMPAYLHFDSPTAAAAEIGNNTTTFSLSRHDGLLDVSRGPTSAVSGAPGELAVEGYLDHLGGTASAQVTGDELTVTGPDGSVAHLVRTVVQANPSLWSCCRPTTDPPQAVAPENVPACSAKDLTGSLYLGNRASYGNYNEVLLRTTGEAPCKLSGPVTIRYFSASGPVSPLDPSRQEAPLDATVLSPTALTPAQDADASWTSAVSVTVVTASFSAKDESKPCGTADLQRIVSLQITFDVGTATLPLPNGLTTCQDQLSLGITPR